MRARRARRRRVDSRAVGRGTDANFDPGVQMSIRPAMGALICALALGFAARAQQYTVRDFMDYAKYAAPKISPDGRFIAMRIREAHRAAELLRVGHRSVITVT